jgi:hypothetical protein
MNWADWVMRLFALFGVLVFTYQVGKHGLQWVMTEISGWFSVAKADFLALEARVKAIEAHPFFQNTPTPSVPPVAPPVSK